jgi:hypothetical protein
VRKSLFGLLHRFQRRDNRGNTEKGIHDKLERLPDWLMERTAPTPDWQDLTPALDRALRSWIDGNSEISRLEAVVSAPYSGVTEGLNHWARAHGIIIVEPLSAAEILAGAETWLQTCLPDDASIPFVIPRLEGFYMRHALGLEPLRRFLGRILRERRRCVIGCSSWAWAYLEAVLQLEKSLPIPWGLDALDQGDLGHWFRDLAARGSGPATVFRQADSGEPIIAPEQSWTDRLAKGKTRQRKSARVAPESSPFLAELAAYCHGNPGLAWHFWRHSLRVTPHTDRKVSQPADKAGLTVWVKPWKSLQLPDLPSPWGRSTLFVLHALLLHERLTEEQLDMLLPLSDFELLQVLSTLERSGLAEPDGHQWRVTGLGYPAVRRTLLNEGYLVDAC